MVGTGIRKKGGMRILGLDVHRGKPKGGRRMDLALGRGKLFPIVVLLD
jgi:hypothetical protein